MHNFDNQWHPKFSQLNDTLSYNWHVKNQYHYKINNTDVLIMYEINK